MPYRKYGEMCKRMAAASSHILAAIARYDRDCWDGYIELIQFRLSGRVARKSDILRQIAEVVDPLILATLNSDAPECLRPLHAAGCVLSEVGTSEDMRRPVLMDEAVESGANRVLGWLLETGVCDVDQPGTYGLTPLHTAARLGRLDSISILLARGAFIDSVSQRHTTPLHLAVENRHPSAVKQLLLAGANSGATVLNGDTALTIAARVGSWECAEILLEHSAPLFAALPHVLRAWGLEKLNHPRLAHVRLERCPREEMGGLFSEVTPDEARVLLARGADPSSAAEHALRHRTYKLLPIIREHGRFPYTEAHYRAAADRALGMSQLLEDGADPDTWVSRGGEARERLPILYYVATEVDTDINVLAMLLQRGADSSVPPGTGLRPLLFELVCRGRLSEALLRVLVELGQAVDARDDEGRSALHALVELQVTDWRSRDTELRYLLDTFVELGADPDARDHHSRTPLMIAVENTFPGTLTRVRALLNNGADARCRDADGMSVLHHFFTSGERRNDEPGSLTAALELLIQSGADLTAQDVRGKYADEVGDDERHCEQRTCVRRIRIRRQWIREQAKVPGLIAVTAKY